MVNARVPWTFLPAGEPLPDHNYGYHALTNEELVAILKELPKRPLLAGEKGVRLSLAGAQDKIAVRVDGDHVSLPLDGAPSTHILKPAIERFEGVVFNEALSMKLAAAVGLPTASVEFRTVEDMTFLLVERYDRIHRQGSDEKFPIERVHQEDFCQALGIVPETKYQKEGGPSLRDCFNLLREVSSTPVIDLARLLDAVIFNYLVGNNDAHGKNFSLLYPGAGTGDIQIRLAPLYDVVSTVYYPELNKEMAMKIGGEYSSERVTPQNFEKLAEEAGLAKPLVRRRVPELAEAILATIPILDTANPVAEGVGGVDQEAVRKSPGRFSPHLILACCPRELHKLLNSNHRGGRSFAWFCPITLRVQGGDSARGPALATEAGCGSLMKTVPFSESPRTEGRGLKTQVLSRATRLLGISAVRFHAHLNVN